MTDLIKQLQYLSRVTKDYDQEHMTSADYEMIPAVTKLAADRIEQLEGERDEAMMTGHDLAKIEYRDLVSDLEANLAKAMEALGNIARQKKTEQIEAEGETEFSDFDGAKIVTEALDQ